MPTNYVVGVAATHSDDQKRKSGDFAGRQVSPLIFMMLSFYLT